MRYVGLDGLRGVAALTVLAFHLAPGGRPGYLSVDLFFALSGFVIAHSYETRILAGMTAWEFAKVRYRRLAPVHFAGAGVGIAVGILLMWLEGAWTPTTLALYGALSICLIPSFWIGGWAFPLNDVQWSLWAEAVVNAIYWVTAPRLSSRVLIVAMATGWSAAVLIASRSPDGWSFGARGFTIPLSLVRAVPAFASGVLIYRLNAADRLARLPRLSPLLLAAGWIAITLVPGNVAYCAAVAIVAVPLFVAFGVRAANEASPVLSFLGALSYPLYAVHEPIMMLFSQELLTFHGKLPPAAYVSALAAAASALLLAYIVLRRCERKFAVRQVAPASSH